MEQDSELKEDATAVLVVENLSLTVTTIHVRYLYHHLQTTPKKSDCSHSSNIHLSRNYNHYVRVLINKLRIECVRVIYTEKSSKMLNSRLEDLMFPKS